MGEGTKWRTKLVWQESAWPHELHEEVYKWGHGAQQRYDFLVRHGRAMCAGFYLDKGDGVWGVEEFFEGFNFDPTHPKTRVRCLYFTYVYWDMGHYMHLKSKDDCLVTSRWDTYANALKNFSNDIDHYREEGDVVRMRLVCRYPYSGEEEVIADVPMKP